MPQNFLSTAVEAAMTTTKPKNTGNESLEPPHKVHHSAGPILLFEAPPSLPRARLIHRFTVFSISCPKPIYWRLGGRLNTVSRRGPLANVVVEVLNMPGGAPFRGSLSKSLPLSPQTPCTYMTSEIEPLDASIADLNNPSYGSIRFFILTNLSMAKISFFVVDPFSRSRLGWVVLAASREAKR